MSEKPAVSVSLRSFDRLIVFRFFRWKVLEIVVFECEVDYPILSIRLMILELYLDCD